MAKSLLLVLGCLGVMLVGSVVVDWKKLMATTMTTTETLSFRPTTEKASNGNDSAAAADDDDTTADDNGADQPVVDHAGRIEGGTKLCAVIRTYPKQEHSLRSLLHTVLDAASVVEDKNMSVQVFVSDTDAKTMGSPPEFIYKILRSMSQDQLRETPDSNSNIHSINNVRVDIASLASYNASSDCRTGGHPDYGYCVTQYILDRYVLDSASKCDWVLFTNGDNLLSRYLIQKAGIANKRIEEVQDMILFDFISHHMRRARDGNKHQNQAIAVTARNSMVDLSSVLFKVSKIRNCTSAKFIPDLEEIEEIRKRHRRPLFAQVRSGTCKASLVYFTYSNELKCLFVHHFTGLAFH